MTGWQTAASPLSETSQAAENSEYVPAVNRGVVLTSALNEQAYDVASESRTCACSDRVATEREREAGNAGPEVLGVCKHHGVATAALG